MTATYLQMLLQATTEQFVAQHYAAIEDALWRGITLANGRMPDISVIRQFATRHFCSAGQDRWEEYRWKEKLMFEVRSVTTEEDGKTFIGTEIYWPK